MSEQTPLYNSRVLSVYLKLLSERYPEVIVDELLEYAGLKSYELKDEGFWVTQEQSDRFFEKIVQLTGNDNIAREAGRLAAAPGTIGSMRQYVFGLLGPGKAFQAIKRGSEKVTRAGEYKSRKIGPTRVEVTVRPYEGVVEREYQCQNRLGFFEALVEGFNLSRPHIDHPECIFKGGKCCRYIVTWKQSISGILSTLRNSFTIIGLLFLVFMGVFAPPASSMLISTLSVVSISLLLALVVEITKGQNMTRSISTLYDSSEKLMDTISINTKNVNLVQEIGETLSNKRSTEDVLYEVAQVMEKSLNFDCGAILLVDEDKTRLKIRSVFGYPYDQITRLMDTSFHLDKPNSMGPFVKAFLDRAPVVVASAEELEGQLSERSQKLIEDFGIESFIACPIIVEDEVLGVLAANNQHTKRPLLNSDLILVQGVAPVIGVALQNVGLLEEIQTSFEKTLQVMAASIDARDHLTAGHSEVVTEYSAAIAEQMNKPDDFVQMMRVAGLLHDYGKISIPDEILKKDGRLTEEEREIINTHPVKTRQILSQVPFRGIHKLIPEITGAHHERWDGTGYPDGLKGDEIPLGARIIAVADFFEAITSKRHYREPMSIERALRLLRDSSGTHFDPYIVDVFIDHLKNNNYQLVKPRTLIEIPTSRQESTGCRRKSPRVEFHTQVSVRYGQRVIAGDLLDISPKGAYIATPDRIMAGDLVTITFSLPRVGEYVRVEARVVWSNSEEYTQSPNHPRGFAVVFVSLGSDVQRVISDFVRCQITSAPKLAPLDTEPLDKEGKRL